MAKRWRRWPGLPRARTVAVRGHLARWSAVRGPTVRGARVRNPDAAAWHLEPGTRNHLNPSWRISPMVMPDGRTWPPTGWMSLGCIPSGVIPSRLKRGQLAPTSTTSRARFAPETSWSAWMSTRPAPKREKSTLRGRPRPAAVRDPRRAAFAVDLRRRESIHAQPQARAPHAVQDAVRHPRRDRLARARHRRERGDLLAVQPDAAAAAAGAASPTRLVNLAAPGPKPGSQSCNQAGDCDEVFSYPMFRDLEKAQTVVHRASRRTASSAPTSRTEGQTLERRRACSSRARYFPVLGLQPALGRLLAPGDDQTIGESPGRGARATLLADAARRRPGRRRTSTIIVNGQTLTIVGVAPRGFDGTTLGVAAAGVRADHDARRRCSPASSGFDEPARATGSICSRGSSPASRSSRPAHGDQRAVSRASSTTSRRRCSKG